MSAETVSEALARGTARLQAVGLERPAIEARLILALSLRTRPEDLLADDRRLLTRDEMSQYDRWLLRRENHEPFAYLQGFKEFYGRKFLVTPDVLIPRPETELLIQGILEWIRKMNFGEGLILDLGTGSGCIGITLGLELGVAWSVVGVDRSSAALLVSQQNADALRGSSIQFCQLNILEDRMKIQKILSDHPQGPAVFVSNPPYIGSEAIADLPPDVRDFEPRLALDGGLEGLDFYQELAFWAHQSSSRPLLWAVETGGFGQIQAVRAMLPSEAEIWEIGPHLFCQKLS